MRTWTRRALWLATLAAGVIIPAAGCVPTDTQSALADLAASTTGSFVQILLKDYLDSHLPGATDPNLTAPISEQQH